MKTERESELNDVILAPVFGKAQGGVQLLTEIVLLDQLFQTHKNAFEEPPEILNY